MRNRQSDLSARLEAERGGRRRAALRRLYSAAKGDEEEKQLREKFLEMKRSHGLARGSIEIAARR